MAHQLAKLGNLNLIISTVIILSFIPPTTALRRSNKQFREFFPAWEPLLKDQLKYNCSSEIEAYLNISSPALRPGYGVIDCILNTMPEFRKAELASAAVILGLAPSVLQLLSASYLDTAILAYRRPGLAVVLAMCSSGVRPLTATDYDDFITKMGTESSTSFGVPRFVGAKGIVSLAEYIIAAASVANNAYLTYQLCLQAVCTFAPAEDFLPAIWTALALAIHLFGYIAARLKITVETKSAWEDRGRLWSELTPTTWQSKLHVKANRRHTGWFLTLASALYVGDCLQALFGTLILSSLVFISVRDSAIIVIRLMGSALLARLILIYELAGLKTDGDGYTASESTIYLQSLQQNERNLRGSRVFS
ncbi:hypothetical protein FOQG_02118 [Fusarium oxysporum f. sp. raphani 54005]|uniref:Uncharacterized protein n=3 Tax=Fusarium oxysporum TaxID=5507 RepID=X0DR00_FUSOX|nr:hypothetical protein FOVG_07165 [Fusarium oxysporum f. sp. pisi HDV247]EXK96682.1 hypothetical protein FOQG_02118 [Fusarium oxysporum f. sp. raphani 54005]KAG7434285.1 hypothetical protein Forpi1262_v003878 [Fusarium oxysporum f. sp. raphani]KAJ4070874.1 hypothetical protein NW753_001738 [Fusarium oxysporum]WKT40469.1 hypothetical protein QSH57_005275 [Fusarium oxysporum f. sp. vasinfectum]